MDERIYWLRVDEKSTRIKKMYGFQEYPEYPEATRWGQLLNLFALTVACV